MGKAGRRGKSEAYSKDLPTVVVTSMRRGEVDIAGATSVTSVNNEHLRVTSFH